MAEGSIMAAFGFNVTTIQLSDENLHGDLPDMSSLVYLESLDVSNNPSLTDGPAWPWLVKMHNMKKINIDNTSRTTQPYGQQCSIDTGGTDAAVHENTCVPGSTCRSHCCGLGVPDTCGYCTNHNEGPCYTPLSASSNWEDAKLALNSTNGWVSRYNKEEHATLKVPSDMADFIVRGGKQVSKSKIEFKLMWSENDVQEDEKSSTPPRGLSSSGSELDPGQIEIIGASEGSTIKVNPQRNGDFTMWLLARDVSGDAVAGGLPKELDQVVMARFQFTVTGRPDFKISGYNNTAQTRDCLIGFECNFTPFNVSDLTYEHNYGVDEDIHFMMTNAPKGAFIESTTGRIRIDSVVERAPGNIDSVIFAVDQGLVVVPMLRVTFCFDEAEFETTDTYDFL